MEIPSHYFLVETSLTDDLFVSAEVLTNIMTGSSPTGLVDLDNPDELQLAEIEDSVFLDLKSQKLRVWDFQKIIHVVRIV